MLKGLSLSELAQKIEANSKAKHDFIADTSKLEMEPQVQEIDGVKKVRHVMVNMESQEAYPILPLAHDQIGGHLAIPAKYYDRMAIETPRLLAANVNTWFQKKPEKRMVRTMHADMRAFLSNRYQRIENEAIARVALPILHDIPDVQIVSSEITEKRMYIQAVSPRVQGEVKKGDVVQAGVIISNSEVGSGAVSVAPIIWRLWCLNGMVIADGKLRGYHVGGRVDSSEELWAADTQQADDRAILLKVRDTVRAAVAQLDFDNRLERMQALATGAEIKRPVAAIEVLAQRFGFGEEDKDDILQHLIQGKDLSAWGMLNAVTAAAHTAKNYDRAVEFEVAGGKLLDLPSNDWREVLQAA